MEQLPDDVVREVLLRFPPADPASLVRAALVCKPWCRIVCGRSFRRRFMEFHRIAPLLGVLSNPWSRARFVPTSSFRPLHTDDLMVLRDCERVDKEEDWRWECVALDARDGLVLFYFEFEDAEHLDDIFLVVWDPTTDERWKISHPDILCCDRHEWHATVLCVSTTANVHLDCHDMSVVVLVVTEWQRQRLRLHVYSSEDAYWSETTLPKCRVDNAPTALVGNTLYFMTDSGKGVLSFDLDTQNTSVIRVPSKASDLAAALMAMEDGGLGFARVDVAARLSLWSMETNPNGDDMRWTQTRVIELEKLLSVDVDSISCLCLGLAHAVGVFFVLTDDGELFSFDLKSGRVKKIYKEECEAFGYDLPITDMENTDNSMYNLL